ncbi:uncharacterized protein LOC123512946 isoform X2 [Portunus trituberculatus]|uniref:uncharacterized protein LOC123512946 isoform X2 n=1 Tax=Portunus trituberculatus TaxID=210409 RepID=UPI001E1CC496|nr:uncharacterized protein LOC123512946 isoform X2 [Portunus trituberculatus]
MRSGQYKLTGAGTRGVIPDVTLGQFRSSQCDLPSPSSEFPHLNSLVVTKSKLADGRPVNKSCENLSVTGGGARGAVTRVEQRVKNLLQRGESRLRQQHSQGAATAEDVWQYGHVVTLPRRPRLSLALSHSALNHITSDTASCLSASSGYSSSSSSNYGSFKSNTSSSCSTLPRHKPGQPPSPHPSRPVTLVGNPMYDMTPSVLKRPRSPPPSPPHHIYDVTPDSDYDACQDTATRDDPLYDTIPAHLTAPPARLLTPDSGTHGGLDSLEESAPNSLECGEVLAAEDQVARQCREYFERRLKNSENLKKRWSMCSSDSGADSGDSDSSPQGMMLSPDPSLSLSPAPTQSSSRVSNDSQDAAAAAAAAAAAGTSGKTALDHKMEFLRKEIASLMSQDNALFRQLLTLHDSISALKSSPIHALRPPSPSSLDSFTEEEEDEEQDDEDEGKEDNESHMPGENLRQQKTSKVEDLSEVDEGLETDHSTSHSTSPSSTLSSKCSWNSHFSSSSKVQLPTPGHLPYKVRGSSADPAPSSPVDQAPLEASTHATPATQTDAESFTSITNITSSKYSITTNEDFNINIAINSNNAGSAFTSGTSQRSISTSCLAKSSCYISSTTPEPNLTKTFGGSLGSFSQQDGSRFTRTRVSIPPSARNRDRSARPESFRLSSDMASHTRVLLKARSFGGASLRESITNKYKKGRDYSRSSLREDHLRYHQHSSMSKVEFQQTGFTTASEKPSVTISNPSSQCSKTEVVHDGSNSMKGQLEGANFHQKQTTSIKETSIVIINTVTRQEEVCHDSSQIHETYENTVINDQEPRDHVTHQWSEPPRKPYNKASSLTSSLAAAESELLPKYKTSVMITDSGLERDSLECSRAQMVRARSFTGLMTPRGITSPSPSPTREILEGSAGSAFLKIPLGENSERLQQVTPVIRRARTSRDGKTMRFSSDLGFGARPKSKREVFV